MITTILVDMAVVILHYSGFTRVGVCPVTLRQKVTLIRIVLSILSTVSCRANSRRRCN